jgi:hypothetical protein
MIKKEKTCLLIGWPDHINNNNNNNNNGLQVIDKHYEQIPERALNANSTTIKWDVPLIMGQTIPANQPDILLHDKKRKDLPTDWIARPD